MSDPIAFFNGQLRPQNEIAIALHDTGFVQGVTVSEQLRTFGGNLFRLDDHLDRLERSLKIVGIESPYSRFQLKDAAQQIVANNWGMIDAHSDLGLALLFTPGPYAPFAPLDCDPRPTVCIHTYPLAYRLWKEKFDSGQALVTTSVRQVPTDCWPSELKCRSRMHYFLADREAQRIEPGARALMQDHDGFVTEASTANLVIFKNQVGLVSPPHEKILPGISVAVMEEIASQLEIPFIHRDLTIQDVMNCQEAFLTSTSPCILPVSRVNGRTLNDTVPGPVYRRLLDAWSQLVGIDIASQAKGV